MIRTIAFLTILFLFGSYTLHAQSVTGVSKNTDNNVTPKTATNNTVFLLTNVDIRAVEKFKFNETASNDNIISVEINENFTEISVLYKKDYSFSDLVQRLDSAGISYSTAPFSNVYGITE